MWQIVEESRKTLGVLPAFSSTFLTLIPKEDKALTSKVFRPITLCNVIFKLITKVLTNWLKPLLPNLISKEQTGYVKGKQILDNIILMQEIIHSLKLNRTPRMLIKLDMSKAFDKISWQYIKEILKAFGFHPTWIHWIHSLISSSFSILLNGIPTSTFRPTRGIRKGEPLSSFLFILIVEGLSRSIQAAISNSTLKGIYIHNLNPPLSHAQLVDDTILMGMPSIREAQTLKYILDNFATASGTFINESKSHIFFFNTPLRIQFNIDREMGFQRSSLPTKYFGIQLSENSLKKAHKNDLLASLEHRLSSWTFWTLNTPAKLILLMSTLQAMPLYIFSDLVAPKSILKKVRNIQKEISLERT